MPLSARFNKSLKLKVQPVPADPDGPEYAAFHALRHSYLTLGGRSGIDLRTLMELAGHSKSDRREGSTGECPVGDRS